LQSKRNNIRVGVRSKNPFDISAPALQGRALVDIAFIGNLVSVDRGHIRQQQDSSAILTAIGNCSANALATSVATMNCTGTDFGRNSGTEIVARKTTLPSSA